MNGDYNEMCRRALDCLKEAQRNLQAAQGCIKTAKRFGVMGGSEHKLLDRVRIDLVEPIDKIEIVVEALRIRIR